jgi:hypothetical protein
LPRSVFTTWLLGGLALAVGLYAWQGHGYWEYSDGVYAYSARAFVNGAVPYRDVAAAQPPLFYVLGAAILSVHDGINWLRASMGAVDLGLAGLVLTATWRLTAVPVATVTAGLLALLTPWALHEHAQLMPETFAAPLLLGAALVGSREHVASLAGALVAAAVFCKLTFVVPGLLMLLVSPGRRRALFGFATASVGLLALFALLFGADVWREAVVAQRQTGLVSLHYAGGLGLQAAWNLSPLLICAMLAWSLREQARDQPLLRELVALAFGTLLLVATVMKRGSYLNVVVVAEPALLILACCAVAWAVRARSPATLLCTACAAFLALQVGSLLMSPDSPRIFTRPFAGEQAGRRVPETTLDRAVRAARSCPPGVADSDEPYIAYLAHRRLPGNQGDPFIIQHAHSLARFLDGAAADQPRCPQ